MERQMNAELQVRDEHGSKEMTYLAISLSDLAELAHPLRLTPITSL